MSTQPTAGIRYVVDKAAVEPGAVVYRGEAQMPDASLAVEARVALVGGGVVARVEGADGPLKAHIERELAALVRAATKGDASADEMPRRVTRWRAAPPV